jgi:hypothetical protein
MSGAANTGKLVNDIRIQNGEMGTQIVEFGAVVDEIDLTTLKDDTFIAWIHPLGACSFTYFGKTIFPNDGLTALGYTADTVEGTKITITDLTGPFPINLKESKLVMTAGKAKVIFGRV